MLREAFAHFLKILEDCVKASDFLLRQPLFANASTGSPSLNDGGEIYLKGSNSVSASFAEFFHSFSPSFQTSSL